MEERALDVLQNIEFAIVGVYRAGSSRLEMDVLDALEALVRRYSAEERGRQPPAALKKCQDAIDALECAWVGIQYVAGHARPCGD